MGLAAFRNSATVRAFIVPSLSSRLRPSCLERTLRDAAFWDLAAGALTTAGFSAAFFAAHRFFTAAIRRFLPSGDILPLRVAGALGTGSALAAGSGAGDPNPS